MIENLSIMKLTDEDFEGAYEVIKTTIPYAFDLCHLDDDDEVKAMINEKRDLLKQSINKDEPIFFIAKHNDKVIVIGKALKLSLPFSPLHTVRETFTSYGVPSKIVCRFSYISLHISKNKI